LERAPAAGCGLIGSKDGGEVLSIAAEDGEIDGSAGHLGLEGHLAPFVNHWLPKKKKVLPVGGTVVSG
jgi:hypothetical protein